MAEPLSLTATLITLIGVSGWLVTTIGDLQSAFRHTAPELRALAGELEILIEVSNESRDTILSAANVSKSIERSLDLCLERQRDLVAIVERDMEQVRRSFAGRLKWMVGKEKRTRAYNSFRDAVLLLRDLVSDLRAQEQFVQIGTTMAIIMEEDAQWGGETTDASGTRQVDDIFETGASIHRGAGVRAKGRSQIMRQMLKNDWISNIMVVVNTGEGGSTGIKFEPARELSDTQSDRSFVSYEFLKRAGIDLAKMERSSAEEIQGIVQGAILTPKHEIELTWYREMGKKMHKGKFLVIGEPDESGQATADSDFDIIMSRAEIARHFRQGLSTFTAASRRRTEDEFKINQEAREKKAKEEAEKERKELEEEAKAKKEARKKKRADESNNPPDVNLRSLNIRKQRNCTTLEYCKLWRRNLTSASMIVA